MTTTANENDEIFAMLRRPRIYAGIGSRETPANILTFMERVAAQLALRGWVMRTGLAPGADQAFYRGSVGVGAVELYLPWPSFEAAALEEAPRQRVLQEPSSEAYGLAERYHPAWERLRAGGRKLQARNSHQIFGEDLETPADLVICWTPDGSLDGVGRGVGGTGQALRIAHDYEIPVINLGRIDHLQGVQRTFLV
jgi:hypothetical protein